MSEPGIHIEQLNEATLQSYQRLLPHQTELVSAGKLHWKFKQNPVRPGAIATYVDPGNTIMALNGFMGVKLRLANGTLLDGYQSMDTIVDPSLRGQGIFTKLHQVFYASQQDGFVYGFPNSSSSPNFFGKLRWQKTGSAPLLFRPLRMSFFLKRLGLKFPPIIASNNKPWSGGVSEISKFSDAASAAWLDFYKRNKFGAGVERNADYLNWRLFAHPSASYQIVTHNDQAFSACTLEQKHGYNIGYVMDAFGRDELLAPMIKAVLRQLKGQGAEVALAMCHPGSTAYAAYRKAGFLPMPDRFRPIQINFGVRSFGSANLEGLSKSQWYVSYLDSDTV